MLPLKPRGRGMTVFKIEKRSVVISLHSFFSSPDSNSEVVIKANVRQLQISTIVNKGDEENAVQVQYLLVTL